MRKKKKREEVNMGLKLPSKYGTVDFFKHVRVHVLLLKKQVCKIAQVILLVTTCRLSKHVKPQTHALPLQSYTYNSCCINAITAVVNTHTHTHATTHPLSLAVTSAFCWRRYSTTSTRL